ncbi:MAG: glycosyltransferase family 2 protein [Myxococcota bacterium]|nr:glycosyltransferase family 2 protein [Myxococcota bacterium]
MKWPSLTIVMAAFNEEDALPTCAKQTLEFFNDHVQDGQLIIVNDGSHDGTAEVMTQLERQDDRVVGVHLEQNSGMGAALLAGYARASKAWVAMMPADGQIDAYDFLNFFEVAPESDVVTSLYSNREYSMGRKVLSYGLRALTVTIVGTRARTEGSYMVRRAVLEGLGARSSSFLLNLEIPIRAKRSGYRVSTVYMKVHERVAGQSKAVNARRILHTFRELFKLRVQIETERFKSDK